MIKKSVFEDDLISGMERELHAQHTQQAQAGVAKALEHLQSAQHILEKAGLKSRATAIQGILNKVAVHHKSHLAKRFPVNLDQIMAAGMTQKDLAEFSKGSPAAKAKLLQTLRYMGIDDKTIANMIGSHNVIPAGEAETLADPNRGFGKMWEWIQSPTSPIGSDPTELNPGEESETLRRYKEDPKSVAIKPEELAFQSLSPETEESPEDGEEVKFKSLAQAFNEAADEADARAKGHKPQVTKSKIPVKINDPHIKGLTSEKMIANLKHHGTVFNMANDGKAEQLLNSDVTEADDNDTLEVSDADSNLEMDFEDEI